LIKKSEIGAAARNVAFLRGINVGGKNILKMETVKQAFTELGFANVKTVLASGNVLFDSPIRAARNLTSTIETQLSSISGREIFVITRSQEYINELLKRNPFGKIKVTPQTRLYVTFLPNKSSSRLKLPHKVDRGNFVILSATDTEVFSVLTVTTDYNSTDGMKILEREYGKKITTRNWNTIEKVAKR
jgi:uncharacterized protein (DUF1697 family)